MAISIRIYLFLDDGSLRRVPRRIYEALPVGEDAIPEYAGTRQRMVQVLVENEDGRPSRILDAIGHFWDFDETGKIDKGLRESAAEWMEYAWRLKPKTAGRVVDLVPEIKKKALHDRHRWDLTIDDLDRIAADIWPGIHGPAPEVSSIKGKAPKRPALSAEAKHALGKIDGQLEMITFELRRLGEHALKGLEFEANRTATFESPDLWRGVAGEAKHQREVKAVHRTGRGEWIAVVEATRSEGQIAERTVATAHERCTTRDAAIAAAKRLMVEKADWIGPDTRIDASICSALEWTEEDD